MSVYLSLIGTLALLAGIFIILGAGALIFFSIMGIGIYIYIYKNNKRKTQRKNQHNWLAQAPMPHVFIAELSDFESIRILLLIYCIYVVGQLSLTDLKDVSMCCAEHIRDHTFQIDQINHELIAKVQYAKNEYSFGLSQVAGVFCVLVTIKTLNHHLIADLIQKLFGSLALEQHDFIEYEDIHLHQVLSAQY